MFLSLITEINCKQVEKTTDKGRWQINDLERSRGNIK